MPLQRFGISRNGEPIHAIPLRNAVKTGISYDDARVEIGLISEFEEREAATFVGVSWPVWEAVDVRERAAMVAHFRMHHQVNLHSVDAVQRKQDMDRKRQEAKARAG